MSAEFDVVTFDCYGTLVDWESGITSAFLRAAARGGIVVKPADVLAAYSRIEPEVESGAYRPYHDVLCETALRVAAECGWTIDRETAAFLPQSLADWPPFDETRDALQRLRDAGIRLGILSNVDIDLLQATLRRLRVEFDLVVTAQDVRAYKPAQAHFVEARKRIGSSRWLHAAQSYFHDVVPATTLGVPTAWINRHGEAPHGRARPDMDLRTLNELADRLTS